MWVVIVFMERLIFKWISVWASVLKLVGLRKSVSFYLNWGVCVNWSVFFFRYSSPCDSSIIVPLHRINLVRCASKGAVRNCNRILWVDYTELCRYFSTLYWNYEFWLFFWIMHTIQSKYSKHSTGILKSFTFSYLWDLLLLTVNLINTNALQIQRPKNSNSSEHYSYYTILYYTMNNDVGFAVRFYWSINPTEFGKMGFIYA